MIFVTTMYTYYTNFIYYISGIFLDTSEIVYLNTITDGSHSLTKYYIHRN